MQVSVGASNLGLVLQAREWVLALGTGTVFSDLESWIKSKEPEWGPCESFLEIVVPGESRNPGSHNQVDILICFPRRAALCELKLYRTSAAMDIRRLYEQIEGQLNLIRKVLRNAGFNPDCICSFLFLPWLSEGDIGRVGRELKDLHHAHHIWPVGANPTTYRSDRNYLVEALETRLRDRETPIPEGQNGLQHYFHELLTRPPAELASFTGFDRAREWLGRQSMYFRDVLEPSLVLGLRTHELEKASAMLQEHSILEVLGPPQIGKTTFIRELLQKMGCTYFPLGVPACRSATEVCKKINDTVRGESPKALAFEEFVRQLSSESTLFWINEYDQLSRPALEKFFDAIQSIEAPPGSPRARWVIESHAPLRGLEKCRCELAPLADSHVNKILALVPCGNQKNDPEVIVRMARGNPGKAKRLWKSSDPASEDFPDECAWFRRCLSRLETRLLSILCVAGATSPLGITSRMLTEWSTRLVSDEGYLPSDVSKGWATLQHKLVDQRLARFTRLDRETVGGLADELIGTDVTVTVISDLSHKLVEDIQRSVGVREAESLREKYHDVLLREAQPGTLSYVTLDLSLGDLESFFRSSFRFTSLRQVLAWIDTRDWECRSPRQSVLLRVLRLLARMDSSTSLDVKTELEGVSGSDDLEKYALDVAQFRTSLKERMGQALDLDSWLHEIGACQNPDLQAEMYAFTVASLPSSGRHHRSQETWSILQDLWKQYPVNSLARSLVVSQVLAFLNRRKFREHAVSDANAYELTRGLSRELLHYGVHVENIQLICDALFYSVRSLEMRGQAASSSEVFGYRAALGFVEDAQRRATRRIQILLTQGSVHRHFCRADNISWDEFNQHMEEGWECYTRALRSAVAQGHVLHTLNATAYKMDFCVKSLRYTGNGVAAAVILERCKEAVALAERSMNEVVALIKGDEEKNILESIRRDYPLVLYVALLPQGGAERERKLNDCFGEYITAILRIFDDARSREQRGRARTTLEKSLKNMVRTMRFCECLNRERNGTLIRSLAPHLGRLLERTRRLFVAKDRGPLQPWKSLLEMYEDALR